jgi:uncharacterized membrane protein YbhN (UPF0104 family)
VSLELIKYLKSRWRQILEAGIIKMSISVMRIRAALQNANLIPFVVKLLISAVLMLFLLWQVDLFRVFAVLRHTNVIYLLIGLILFPAGQIICAIKWQYLARSMGIHRDLKPMVGLYFIGMFFNFFLPTAIGGDITRGLYLTSDSRSKRIAFLSVIVERGTGVMAMVLLASIAMLSPYGVPLPPLLRFGFPIASILGFVTLWFLPFLIGHTRTRLRHLIQEDLIIFWKRPGIGVVAVFYSLIFHCILVVIHVCIARALSLNIPVAYHFITESLSSLAGLLPSFRGIGVRDASYIYLLGRIGVNQAYGLVFSFLWFLSMAFSGFIGLIVYLTRGLSPVSAKIADQPESYHG